MWLVGVGLGRLVYACIEGRYYYIIQLTINYTCTYMYMYVEILYSTLANIERKEEKETQETPIQ